MIFSNPLAFGAPVGISPSRVVWEKLEWWGSPTVKIF